MGTIIHKLAVGINSWPSNEKPVDFELKIWAPVERLSKEIPWIFLLQTTNEAILYVISKSCFEIQNPESSSQFCELPLLWILTLTTNMNIIYFLIWHVLSHYKCKHHITKQTVPFCGIENTTNIFSNFTNFNFQSCLVQFHRDISSIPIPIPSFLMHKDQQAIINMPLFHYTVQRSGLIHSM